MLPEVTPPHLCVTKRIDGGATPLREGIKGLRFISIRSAVSYNRRLIVLTLR
jgi:hypothetical protein